MTTTEKPAHARLLTVPQASEWLGYSERKIWKMLAARELTPIRLGRRATRIAADEVERLIAAARLASAK